MGTVHRGYDLVLQRVVAVKLVKGVSRDPNWRKRVLREARAAAALNHPNVVALYDVGEHDKVPYLVMEYVAGRSLADEPPTTIRAMRELTSQLCDALDHAHGRGFVHRDLKPGNVLLSREDGRVTIKLADLGLARNRNESHITGTDQILGTPSYMAPEQALGDPVDGRTDLYALGAMLYEWLTGQPPFTGETPLVVAMQHIKKPVVPPRERRPGLAPELEAIVLRLLAKSPAERYGSALELQRALADLDRSRHSPVAAETLTLRSAAASTTPRIEHRTDAHELCLRGRHHLRRGRRGELEAARTCFLQAVDVDADCAPAWAGIADCASWTYLYYGAAAETRREAVRAGARAVELAPDRADARTARAVALSLERRDVEASEEFERSVELFSTAPGGGSDPPPRALPRAARPVPTRRLTRPSGAHVQARSNTNHCSRQRRPAPGRLTGPPSISRNRPPSAALSSSMPARYGGPSMSSGRSAGKATPSRRPYGRRTRATISP